jgi:hypothetical protein
MADAFDELDPRAARLRIHEILDEQLEAARLRMPAEHIAKLLDDNREVLAILKDDPELGEGMRFAVLEGSLSDFIEKWHEPILEYLNFAGKHGPGRPWLQFQVFTVFRKAWEGQDKYPNHHSPWMDTLAGAQGFAREKLKLHDSNPGLPKILRQWIDCRVVLRPVVVEFTRDDEK